MENMKRILIGVLIILIAIAIIIVQFCIELWTGWTGWVISWMMVVILCCYVLWHRWLLKRRLIRYRIDIKATVQRLKNRKSTGDISVLDYAIDSLIGIDDSYLCEVPFLIEALEQENDSETLNFIICVLYIMKGTLNEQIISILGEKIIMISDKIARKELEEYDTYEDTLVYIFRYLVLQGQPHKEAITQVLQRVISAKIIPSIRADAMAVLRKLDAAK